MLSLCVLIFEIVVLGLINFGADEVNNAVISAVMILFFSAAFLFETAHKKEFKPYFVQLCAGYLFRIFLLVFDIYGKDIYSLPGSGGDSEGFYRDAVVYAGGNEIDYGGTFSRMMGLIARVVGTERLYLQFFVVLFSMVAIIFAIKTMKYVDVGARVKHTGIALLCLLPNFAILSSIFVRESVIAMALSISLYYFVKWFDSDNLLYFIFSLVFVMFASAFHSGTVGVAVGYVAVMFLYNARRKEFVLSAKSILLTLICVVVFAFLYINYADVLFGKMSKLEGIEDIASGTVSGGSSYAQYVGNSASPLNMVIYTVPRMFFFLFSPLPIFWRGLSDVIAFCFNSLFYLWVWFDVIMFLRSGNGKNRNLVIALMLVALCTVFIFGWGVSNSGTAVRHRDKVIVLYAVLWCLTNRRYVKITL